VETPYPTPLLLGLANPHILLSPRVAAALTDAELEMAFRHELAHFCRRDHWYRWVIAWLEDVGRPCLLTGWLGAEAVVLEEQLCDSLAVRTPQDAMILAQALRKSLKLAQRTGGAPGRLPAAASVVPAFLGRSVSPGRRTSALARRLEHLVTLAEGTRRPSGRDSLEERVFSVAAIRGRCGRSAVLLWRAVVLLLLFLILYIRFHLLLNVS
jgi:hypothetical protein